MKAAQNILPPNVIVSLYKDSLVVVENEIKPKKTEENTSSILPNDTNTNEPTTTLKYLGDHHKKIMVIVNDPASVYLNETDFILLTTILNACRLTIADVALINIGQQKTSLHEMLTILPSTLVLAFDIEAKALKIKLPSTLYSLINLGETHLLFSAALSSMQGTGVEAKKEKAKLWAILKQIFQL